MRVVELNRSPHRHKTDSSSEVDETLSSSIHGLGWNYTKNIVWKYWVVIVNVNQSVFQGPVKFSERFIINIKSAVYIKRFVILIVTWPGGETCNLYLRSEL